MRTPTNMYPQNKQPNQTDYSRRAMIKQKMLDAASKSGKQLTNKSNRKLLAMRARAFSK